MRKCFCSVIVILYYFFLTFKGEDYFLTKVEKYSRFHPETAPLLSIGSIWYCSSPPFTWVEWQYQTPWTRVKLFQEESSHILLISLNP